MYKKKKMTILSKNTKMKQTTCNVNVMNSMSEKEINTLINLLRHLENKGCIIIVENDISEIHNEIRLFNPEGDVYSTYQSLNPDNLVPRVELLTEEQTKKKTPEKKMTSVNVKRTPAPPGAIRKKVIPIGVRKKQQRRGPRLTRMSKIARRRLKEKQEQELELALAEATRGTYVGKPPTPKPSTILLLRQKYRPQVKCTITNIPIKPKAPESLVNPSATISAVVGKLSQTPKPPTEPTTNPSAGIPPGAVHVTPTPRPKPPPVQKDYKCEQCDKILKTKASLKSHMISHSNLQEVICHYCGKTFNHSRGLKRHLILHEGSRKYTCKHCPSTFMFLQKLKEHTLTHTGEKRFHCTVCNRAFITRKHLKTHEVVHSEKRPFECTYCTKSFRRVSHLTQHVRIHTGEKRFHCIPCGKGFVQQTSLQCHNKTHHKDRVQEEIENQTVTTTVSENETEDQNQSFTSHPTTVLFITTAEPSNDAPTGTQVNQLQHPCPYPWKRHLAQKSTVIFPAVEQETPFVWKPHLAKTSEPAAAAQTTTTILVPVTDYNQPPWPSTSTSTPTFYQFS